MKKNFVAILFLSFFSFPSKYIFKNSLKSENPLKSLEILVVISNNLKTYEND